MKLPLVPKHEKDYTVNRYPSNAEVLDLVRVHLRNETLSEEIKTRMQEEYSLSDASVTDELGKFEAEHEAAAIVFEDFEVEDAGPMEISANAVGEATDYFMGAEQSAKNGLSDTLSDLASVLKGQSDTR